MEGLLDDLGVGDRLRSGGYVRFPGNRLAWGDQRHLFLYGDGRQGWQVPRRDLDAMLLDEAVRLGAVLLQPCAVRGLFASKGRVVGAVTAAGPFRADYVLDAGGGGHWLAGKTRVPVHTHSPPLHATFGYAHGRPDREDLPSFASDAEGWSWVSRVGAEHYQFTRLDFDPQGRPADWLPAELRGLEPGRPRGGMLSTWREMDRVCGPGWFAAGDAAAVFDPASLQGVMKGLLSGMKAVHAIHRILQEGVPEAEEQARYGEWFRSWYRGELTKLRDFYGLHPRRPFGAPIEGGSGPCGSWGDPVS